MKNSVEISAKSIEEAVRRGIEELKVSREDVIVEVLEEPVQGTLSFLDSKLAKVKLTVCKKVSEEVLNKTKVKVSKIIKDIIDITKDDVEVNITEQNNFIYLELNGEGVSHLIGYNGTILDSIQMLINAGLAKSDEEYAKVCLEINGYKAKKEKNIKRLANKMAENAVRFNKQIKLEPMTAYERKIVHAELQNNDKVYTESIGEEPRRRVVIKLKRN